MTCAIEDTVADLVTCMPFSKNCVISNEDVINAVSKLKAHRNDGSSASSLDYFINVAYYWMVHIACSFSATHMHGSALASFYQALLAFFSFSLIQQNNIIIFSIT